MKYDGDFLKQLDNSNIKNINIRITSYGMDDSPNEIIEGKIISGSINIDGTSNIRRSCSLGLIASDISINEYYWCFNTRFQIEIGVENTINSKYPNMIWFNMGYFLITSFNTSVSVNGYNISIAGKDKMCLLNGELGGLFESSVVFDTDEFEDLDGTITRTKIPIKTIIKNLIHFYGGEPYYKILINDVPDYGLELERYTGSLPFYLLGSTDSRELQPTIDENALIAYALRDNSGNLIHEQVGEDDSPIVYEYIKLKDIPSEKLYYANELIQDEIRNFNIWDNKRIRKIEYGESCGYKIVDLIYPSDLIANPGEAITSILDKIKSMLGPYEYFYDLNGNFVFQKQQKFIPSINYTENTYNAVDSQQLKTDTEVLISYSFDNNNLITSLQNNPNHNAIKNDFIIWGKGKTVNNQEVPIHLRFAIDNKPMYTYESIGLDTIYKNEETRAMYLLKNYPNLFPLMNNETYGMAEKRLKQKYQSKQYDLGNYDWRELIYQMAKDFFAFNQVDEYRNWLEQSSYNKKWIINGQTGYEPYYTDIEGFWRQIYKTEQEQINIYNILKEQQQYSCYIDERVEKYIYDLSAPYYVSFESSKRLIPDFYYGTQRDNIHKIDANIVIEKNYSLLQQIFKYIVENYNFNQGHTEIKVNNLYYKEIIDVGSEKKEEYKDIKTLSSISSMFTTDLNTELDNCLTDVFNKELFLKVNNDYLSQGTLQWPLYICTGRNPGDETQYKDIYEIILENNKKISFKVDENPNHGNIDDNTKLLWNLALATLDGNNIIVGYWNEDFFPFQESFATKNNGYVAGFKGFNKSILKNPENLKFWFDLFDKENSEAAKYSVHAIGNRKKVVSDDNVKSIYYSSIPDIIFDTGDYTEEQQIAYNNQDTLSGYVQINIPSEIKEDFNISTQGKSAYSLLENLLYNYTYCADQTNITAIPVYYLQPNTIINIYDKETSIDGNYIIQRISYNLSSNSTMSLQCVKNIENNRDRKEILEV